MPIPIADQCWNILSCFFHLCLVIVLFLLCMGGFLAIANNPERVVEVSKQNRAREITEDIQEMCIAGKLFVRTTVHRFGRDSYEVQQIFDTDEKGNRIAIDCK